MTTAEILPMPDEPLLGELRVITALREALEPLYAERFPDHTAIWDKEYCEVFSRASIDTVRDFFPGSNVRRISYGPSRLA